MGSGSFPGLKLPGRGVDHPPLSNAEVRERVELYLYPPVGLRDLFYVESFLYFTYSPSDTSVITDVKPILVRLT